MKQRHPGHPDEVVIIGAKTDQYRDSNAAERMIYLQAVPNTLERYDGNTVRRQVTYRAPLTQHSI